MALRPRDSSAAPAEGLLLPPPRALLLQAGGHADVPHGDDASPHTEPARFCLSPTCARGRRESAQTSSPSLPSRRLESLAGACERGAGLLARAERRVARDVDVCLTGAEEQESLTPFSSAQVLLEAFLDRYLEDEEKARKAHEDEEKGDATLAFGSLRDAATASSSSSSSPSSAFAFCCPPRAYSRPRALFFKRPLLPLLPFSLSVRTLHRRQLPPELVACLHRDGGVFGAGDSAASPLLPFSPLPCYQLLEPLQALCCYRGSEAFLVSCLVSQSPCLRVGPLQGGDILSVHLSPAPVGLLFPSVSHLLFFLTPAVLHVFAVVGVALPSLPAAAASGAPSEGAPAQAASVASLLVCGGEARAAETFLAAETGALPLLLPAYAAATPAPPFASAPLSPSVRLTRGAFRLVRLQNLSLALPDELRVRFAAFAAALGRRAALAAASGGAQNRSRTPVAFFASTLDGAVFLSAPEGESEARDGALHSCDERRRERTSRQGDVYQLVLRAGAPSLLHSPASLKCLSLSAAPAAPRGLDQCLLCRKRCQPPEAGRRDRAALTGPPPHTRGDAGVKLLRSFPAGLLAVVDDRDGLYVYRLVSRETRRGFGALAAAARPQRAVGPGGHEATLASERGAWSSLFSSAATTFAGAEKSEEGMQGDASGSEEEAERHRQGWAVASVLGAVSQKIRKLLSRPSADASESLLSAVPSLWATPAVLPASRLSAALAERLAYPEGFSSSLGANGESEREASLGAGLASSPSASPCPFFSLSREAYEEAAAAAPQASLEPWIPMRTRGEVGAYRDRVASAVPLKGLECVAYLPARAWRRQLLCAPRAEAPERPREGEGRGLPGSEEEDAGRTVFFSFFSKEKLAKGGVARGGRRCAEGDDSVSQRACEDALLSIVDVVPSFTAGPHPTVTVVTARGDRVILRLLPSSASCQACRCPAAGEHVDAPEAGLPLCLLSSSVLPSPFFPVVACPSKAPSASRFASPLPRSLEVSSAATGACSYYGNGLSLFAASPSLVRLASAEGPNAAGAASDASAAFVSLRISLPASSSSCSPFFLSSSLPVQLPSAPLAAGEVPLFFASTGSSPSFSLPATDGLAPSLDLSLFASLGLAPTAAPLDEAALVRRHLLIACETEVLLVSVERTRAYLASPGDLAALPVAEAYSAFSQPPTGPRALAARDASWALETCTAARAAAAASLRARAHGAATAVVAGALSGPGVPAPASGVGPLGTERLAVERRLQPQLANASFRDAVFPPEMALPVWTPSLWACLFQAVSEGDAVARENGGVGAGRDLFFTPPGCAAEGASQQICFVRRLHLALAARADDRSDRGAPAQSARSEGRGGGEQRPGARRGGRSEEEENLGWWAEEEGREAEGFSNQALALGWDHEPEVEEVAPWIDGLAARAALLLRVVADWPVCVVNASLLDPYVSGSLLPLAAPSPLAPSSPSFSSLPPRLFPLCVRWNAAYLAALYDHLNAFLHFLYLQCLPTSSLAFLAALLAAPLSPAALLREAPGPHRDAAARARAAVAALLEPRGGEKRAGGEDACGAVDAEMRGEDANARRGGVKGSEAKQEGEAKYREQQLLLLGLTLSLLRAREILYLFLLLQELSPARQQHVWFLLLSSSAGDEAAETREKAPLAQAICAQASSQEAEASSRVARLLLSTPFRALLFYEKAGSHEGEDGEEDAGEELCVRLMHALLLLDPSPQRPGSITRRLFAALPWLAAKCSVSRLLPRWWSAETEASASLASLASCRRLSRFVSDLFAGFPGFSQEAFFATAMEHFVVSMCPPRPHVALHFALRLLVLRAPSSTSSLPANPEAVVNAFGEAVARGAAREAERVCAREGKTDEATSRRCLAEAWARFLAAVFRYELQPDAFFEGDGGEAVGSGSAQERGCEAGTGREREEVRRVALQRLQWAALDQLFGVYTLQLPPLPGEASAQGDRSRRLCEARAFGVFGPFQPPGNGFVISALEDLIQASLDCGVCTPEAPADKTHAASPFFGAAPVSSAVSFPPGAQSPSQLALSSEDICSPAFASAAGAAGGSDADGWTDKGAPLRATALSPEALRSIQVYLHHRFFQEGKAAQGDVLLREYRHHGARVESAAVLCALATRGGRPPRVQDASNLPLEEGAGAEEDADMLGEKSEAAADAPGTLLLPLTVRAEALRWAEATLNEVLAELQKEAEEGGETQSADAQTRDDAASLDSLLRLFGQFFQTAEEIALLARAGQGEAEKELEDASEKERVHEEGERGVGATSQGTKRTIARLTVVKGAVRAMREVWLSARVTENVQLPLWRHLKDRLERQHTRALRGPAPAPASFCLSPEAGRVSLASPCQDDNFPAFLVPAVSLSGVCTLGQQLETVPKLFQEAQLSLCVPLALRAVVVDFRRLASRSLLALLPPPVAAAAGPEAALAQAGGGEAGEEAAAWSDEVEDRLLNSPQVLGIQSAADAVRETAETLLCAFAARLALAPACFRPLTATLDLPRPASPPPLAEAASPLIENVLAVCMYSWSPQSLSVCASVARLPPFSVGQSGSVELLASLETLHAFSRRLSAGARSSGLGDHPAPPPVKPTAARLLVAQTWLGLGDASSTAYVEAFRAYAELLQARDRLLDACERLSQLLAEVRAQAEQLTGGRVAAHQALVFAFEDVEEHVVAVILALVARWLEHALRAKTQAGGRALSPDAEGDASELRRGVLPFLHSVLRQSEAAAEEDAGESAARDAHAGGARITAEAAQAAREALAKLESFLGVEEL
ncbi:hypothetical protein BESB_067680 [Besnoitia besnoiti]|uniref:Uncharacterized protein n=1 Tax=Besnoitia besnoiti TaxID=94643 RepID=A0A2A9M9Q8_BESBE|nr:hypothetical protein BESB_067680 [Besnoitia besnoiti]PFH34735.1 hypothetical protein BESB_067680 [Besnoitia besnoiti]